ncbi:hypothetical protein D3C77_313120 [compost metagenome]
MRKHPFLHADNKDDRELQPLGAMHRHQSDRIARLIPLFIVHRVNIRDQRKIG